MSGCVERKVERLEIRDSKCGITFLGARGHRNLLDGQDARPLIYIPMHCLDMMLYVQ